ncbi:MAG TPA: DUF3606 domain-containing protein [Casimicrobiaceae bacterium]|jgi:hypothetical protein
MANGLSVARVVSAGRVPGRDRINTGRDYEVRYWSARLGCTTEELCAAIRVVGNSIGRVREYVADHRHARFPSIHMHDALES